MESLEYLKQQNAALAAQVEALKKDKSDLLAYVNDAERWFNKHDPNGYVSPNRETAQHHLRQVRADAYQSGFVKGAKVANESPQIYAMGLESVAKQYADSILAGKE